MYLNAGFEEETLKKLKHMMQNPSYWRDRDPDIVNKVTKGFELLYDQPSNDSELPEARQGQLANILGINGSRNKEDTKIAHMTPGEIVIPLNYQTPAVMKLLDKVMGEDLVKYTVGSGEENINPESGLPAFYSEVKSLWAGPKIWGPWISGPAVFGNKDRPIPFSVSFESISSGQSPFSVQLSYSGKTVNREGSSSYSGKFEKNALDSVKIRAKSHSMGQDLRITFS